jgi:hypothetical protein
MFGMISADILFFIGQMSYTKSGTTMYFVRWQGQFVRQCNAGINTEAIKKAVRDTINN